MSVRTCARSSFWKALPLTIVHAGHDPSFGKARLDAIIAAYRVRWRDEGLI